MLWILHVPAVERRSTLAAETWAHEDILVRIDEYENKEVNGKFQLMSEFCLYNDTDHRGRSDKRQVTCDCSAHDLTTSNWQIVSWHRAVLQEQTDLQGNPSQTNCF